jgi:phosphoglycerate dehydrogenase-like enzyme
MNDSPSRKKPLEKTHLPTILLVRSAGFPQEWIAEMQALFPDLTFLVADDNEASIHAVIQEANALIGCPRHIFTPDLLRKAKNLVWVHGTGAGVEQFIFPDFVDSGILFTNGRIIQGPEVADHALALILALSRNIGRMLKGQERRDMPRAIELRKKTCLVLGLGGVGLLVAERVKAFDMYTVGIANDLAPMVSFVDEFYGPEELLTQLPRADVVVCAAPHTERTRKLLDTTHFAAMKNDSIFVNVSRGAIVDTDALLSAVRAGKFRGVGLDVTDPEPLPSDHPLWSFPHVLITPHMAGPSDHNRRRSFELIAANIARFLRGENLFNVVNKELGY